MKVSHGLFPQQEFLERRSQHARERVRTSLAKPEARPVVVGVGQIGNHHSGMAGKAANLERLLRAVEAAAAEGVQVLVLPEMCLPGYFVREHGTPEQAKTAVQAVADEVERLGGELVDVPAYEADRTEFVELAREVRRARPDVIVFADSAARVALTSTISDSI